MPAVLIAARARALSFISVWVVTRCDMMLLPFCSSFTPDEPTCSARSDLGLLIALRADVLVGELLAERVCHLVDVAAQVLTTVEHLGDDGAVLLDGGLALHGSFGHFDSFL